MATKNLTFESTVTLNNGIEMPHLGFGVCMMPDGKVTSDSVYAALKAGYRNLDTAAAYGNERGVGDGIRRAIADGIVTRKDVFLCRSSCRQCTPGSS